MENRLIDKLLDIPLVWKYLGEWSAEKHYIMLYDVPKERIKEIKDELEKVSTKFKFIPLSPKEVWGNINILDIDL